MEEKIIESTPKNEIVDLDLDQLRSNPYQPRKTFDEEALQELSNYFDTKANLRRKLKSGDYFTSRKSKLYGWRVRLVQEIV